ncbi:DUF1176 domain-containing protein [Blastomonas sp.]|uniref:DUF1176 domain-containing protein n=1 Tax=Blastomonas sp. TaxID=1909299 RepID=UPI00359480E5
MITALLLLASAAATPVPGEVRTFGDWYVACDNIWACEAGTLADNGGDFKTAMAVRIRRGGGPDAPFRIGLHPGEEVTAGPARLQIDARPAFGGTPDSEGDTWLDGQQVPAIARLIANGKKAALILSDSSTLPLSLAGSSAALRYMDAAQQRAGTSGAIVATGNKLDTAVPPRAPNIFARKAPAMAGLPDMKDYPQVIAATGCEYRMEGVEDSVFPLDRQGGRDMALALIACDAGAYNVGSVVMIAERPTGDPKAKWTFRNAEFDSATGWGGKDQQRQVVNAGFTPETGALSEFAKGRGLGDCGTANVFAWDGSRFRLSEMHGMGECRGVWEWPRLWVAEVTVAE